MKIQAGLTSLLRFLVLGVVVSGCVGLNLPASQGLLAGDTGERVCGDSTLFSHSITQGLVAEEGMILSPDSLGWVITTDANEIRLAAPIDRRLVIRDAVVKHRYALDTLLKNWNSDNGRLEIRDDTAQYSVGGKEAHVERYPIARDAAVFVGLSATFYELLIRRARMTGQDSVDIPTFFIAQEGFAPIAYVRSSGRTPCGSALERTRSWRMRWWIPSVASCAGPTRRRATA